MVLGFAGDATRRMTPGVRNNGRGGLGHRYAIHGGFRMLCDGSQRANSELVSAMVWDVLGGQQIQDAVILKELTANSLRNTKNAKSVCLQCQ